MRVSSTAARLKQVMSSRQLRQVDLLEMCRPYCQQYGVKLGKSHLSQFLSGKIEPGQKKLSILSKALGVSEAWLMGYDVSPIVQLPDSNQQTKQAIPEDGLSDVKQLLIEEILAADDADIADLVAYLKVKNGITRSDGSTE